MRGPRNNSVIYFAALLPEYESAFFSGMGGGLEEGKGLMRMRR